ncbi:6-hydroxymethylpterin diphosphokinase MptE-like protein [Anoxybacillus sp. TBDG-1]
MRKENVEWLQQRFPHVLETVMRAEHAPPFPHHIISRAKGKKTIQVGDVYVHDPIDPLREVDALIYHWREALENCEHILFYGVGLGYHIERVMARFPHKTFTLYEPNVHLFTTYVSHRSLLSLPVENLEHIHVETDEMDRREFLHEFVHSFKTKVFFFSLPSYEQLFHDQYAEFLKQFREVVEMKRMSNVAEAAFNKNWVINSMMNLCVTLKSPNIFTKRAHFEHKPVLIVSAGPSLHEEYDHLRYIKERGLAYIVAVGSANKALVAQRILPDAVCTYDPQDHNYTVFSSMIEQGLDVHVPMIYGTSVGYKTLQLYRGPKLHAVTAQDFVTPYFTDVAAHDIVDDAFSVAIIALQIFARLGANPIVLVGQNFAFLHDAYYAHEIATGDHAAAEREKRNVLFVRDVEGNEVMTNRSLNQMRLLMEQYIQLYSHIEVINTTKKGADIAGAPFMSLERVISERLHDRVVAADWYVGEEERTDGIEWRTKRMKKAMREFMSICVRFIETLERLGSAADKKRWKQLPRLLEENYARFQELFQNDFYRTYMFRATQGQAVVLMEEMSSSKATGSIEQKMERLIHLSLNYVKTCIEMYNELSPIVHEQMHAVVGDEMWKRYGCTADEFHFSDGWQTGKIEIAKKYVQPQVIGTYYVTSQKGASVTFTFEGTALRIYGGQHINGSKRIRIRIDNYEQTFSAQSTTVSQWFIPDLRQLLFEKKGLNAGTHTVTITLVGDGYFIFQGVEVNRDGQLKTKEQI